MSDDTRDRLIALEVQVQHLNEKLDEATEKVSKLYELMMQAKGFRWFIVSLAAVAGFVAAMLTKIPPWFGSVPK